MYLSFNPIIPFLITYAIKIIQKKKDTLWVKMFTSALTINAKKKKKPKPIINSKV